MVKIRISISNKMGYWDDDLCADILLPQVPNVNDTLHLTRDVLDGLEFKYSKLSNCRQKDFEEWVYKRGVSFDDAIFVYAIRYVSNRDYTEVCLNYVEYKA